MFQDCLDLTPSPEHIHGSAEDADLELHRESIRAFLKNPLAHRAAPQ